MDVPLFEWPVWFALRSELALIDFVSAFLKVAVVIASAYGSAFRFFS
jgi:hypothetical protein